MDEPLPAPPPSVALDDALPAGAVAAACVAAATTASDPARCSPVPSSIQRTTQPSTWVSSTLTRIVVGPPGDSDNQKSTSMRPLRAGPDSVYMVPLVCADVQSAGPLTRSTATGAEIASSSLFTGLATSMPSMVTVNRGATVPTGKAVGWIDTSARADPGEPRSTTTAAMPASTKRRMASTVGRTVIMRHQTGGASPGTNGHAWSVRRGTDA
ncbi:hypothetical protein OHA72_35400 [Dactylosporangium sp. NBC_01737]|uniref:hypothetical protein n=1 Tax=Dactylosporangium sp. NBC_01737 TaxID=2975959 RepID=UPI002E0DA4CF|nr:hypothetical protein OHA72_35400 [Dactylosporangium sp. NBC_01737]